MRKARAEVLGAAYARFTFPPKLALHRSVADCTVQCRNGVTCLWSFVRPCICIEHGTYRAKTPRLGLSHGLYGVGRVQGHGPRDLLSPQRGFAEQCMAGLPGLPGETRVPRVRTAKQRAVRDLGRGFRARAKTDKERERSRAIDAVARTRRTTGMQPKQHRSRTVGDTCCHGHSRAEYWRKTQSGQGYCKECMRLNGRRQREKMRAVLGSGAADGDG